jgi:monofunctional biosynthetic peptidoglycan transglycosylase
MRFFAVFMLLCGAFFAAVLLYWHLTLPDMTALAKTNPPSTAFMEARKTEAREQGRPFQRRWIWVPLARISPHLQRAVVVAEDAAFFRHKGFDWEGIKEAVTRNWERGEFHRGGSTITQQLAKNLYLSSDKNIFRKLHELVITRALEEHLTKRRILELYLNLVEWGDGVYGAEAAAWHHFNKHARDLTTEEAALLAAILPAPRRSDPIRVTPYLVKRQRQILRWMRDGHDDTNQSSSGADYGLDLSICCGPVRSHLGGRAEA